MMLVIVMSVGALRWMFVAAKLKLYKTLFCVKNGNGNSKTKLIHV